MARRTVKVTLAPTTRTFLMCIGCGRFHCDYEIVVDNGQTEPQAGLHKKCMTTVHTLKNMKGGASVDAD